MIKSKNEQYKPCHKSIIGVVGGVLIKCFTCRWEHHLDFEGEKTWAEADAIYKEHVADKVLRRNAVAAIPSSAPVIPDLIEEREV